MVDVLPAEGAAQSAGAILLEALEAVGVPAAQHHWVHEEFEAAGALAVAFADESLEVLELHIF